MVPIPFGAVIPEGITPGDEFIEVFGAISAEHSKWAKLIMDQIEQSESDNDHVTIYRRIMDARVLRGERDPACAATAGIHTMLIPTSSPFIGTTRIGNRFPEALAILRAVFVRNPMPIRVKLGASDDDESYPEVNIEVQPNRQTQRNQQPPVPPQQQHGQPAQMPQLPLGPPNVAVPQQLQQPFIAQQPPQQLPMNQLPHQPPVVLQQPQFLWQVPAAPIPENPGFAVQNWQTQQPMIFRSEAENESKQAAKLQTDILKLFFINGKIDWEEAKVI